MNEILRLITIYKHNISIPHDKNVFLSNIPGKMPKMPRR
jgi:hypothetical protein